MNEHIRQFIDQLAAGESAEAKNSLENILASKSFEALDEFKKQIAQGAFGGGTKEEPQAETDVEVQEAE